MEPTHPKSIQTEPHATGERGSEAHAPDRVGFTQQFLQVQSFSALVSPPKPPPSEAHFSYRLGGFCFILGGETHHRKTTPPIPPNPLGSGTCRIVAMAFGHKRLRARSVAAGCRGRPPTWQLNQKPLCKSRNGLTLRTSYLAALICWRRAVRRRPKLFGW